MKAREDASEARVRYDAIVLGAGHNGLVTAAYLARAGRRVVVLERRPVIGGATLTEEPLPGYKYSVFSYLVSLLRPEVIHELDLVRHGLFLIPLDSTLNPLPGGDEVYREADPGRTFRNLARHSRRDAEAYADYKLTMSQIAHFVRRLQDTAAPELMARELDGVEHWEARDPAVAEVVADLGRHFLQAPRTLVDTFLRMLVMSASDFLDLWFENDAIKAALSTSSIIGSAVAPRSPGSAYVLLHHYMGELDGVYRAWGFQRGGTGAVADTLARAAVAHGAVIRTSATAARVIVRDGRVAGVALENGDEVEANVVCSSLAPQLSLGALIDPGLLPDPARLAVERWDSRGSSGKVNLALSGLPRFACRPEPGAHLAGGISIAPSIDTIEQAFDDAKYGRFSRRPFLDLVVPSYIDPGMAPPGHHVVSCFVQYAPYHLAEGTWDDQREAFGDAVIDVLEEYAPGIRSLILHRQVLSPLDIERTVGIPGGNIFHGELRLSQLFLSRPAAGLASYRTPIPGYYLCGSSSHPGGGISGAPGRFAAAAILAA